MSTIVMFGPTDHGRRVTKEELEHAQWQEGYRYEIIDGRISVAAAPNVNHAVVVDWVADLLKTYARQHPEVVNRVTHAARIPLLDRPELTVPEPDVTAFQNYPWHQPPETLAWGDLTPYLVVEVLSEDNSEKDLERNVELYLEVPSIREYWILDPRPGAFQTSLYVYRRRGNRWQKRMDFAFGSEYTTRFLPGFKLVIDPRQP